MSGEATEDADLLKRFSFGRDPTGRAILQVLARTSLWAFRCKCERFSETVKTINKTELIPHANQS